MTDHQTELAALRDTLLGVKLLAVKTADADLLAHADSFDRQVRDLMVRHTLPEGVPGGTR